MDRAVDFATKKIHANTNDFFDGENKKSKKITETRHHGKAVKKETASRVYEKRGLKH